MVPSRELAGTRANDNRYSPRLIFTAATGNRRSIIIYSRGSSAGSRDRHYWRQATRFRPLSKSDFDRFLPTAPGAIALKKMLSLFGEPTITYETVLILRADDVKPVCLVGGTNPGARLGLDGFLLTVPDSADRTDMRYDLRPMEPLPPRRTRGRAR